MQKIWILAVAGLIFLAAGAADDETPVEQVALEAEKSEKTPAPVTLVSCSAQILSKARQVQAQIRGNNKADQEFTELLAWKKQLTKLRLCSTAIFAVSYTHLTLPTTPYV